MMVISVKDAELVKEETMVVEDQILITEEVAKEEVLDQK